MSNQPSLEEFTRALEDLPPEFKSQLATVVHPSEEIDTVGIKLELVKFATELQKYNQGIEWETNKLKPKAIVITKVIDEAQELFDFLTS